MSHFISFIIPVYNRAKVVGRAIESIYAQGLAEGSFEVICTDDGSVDGSFATLERYTHLFENFCVCRLASREGVSAARNCCVSHSKGDLIFNLDSDNRIMPNSVPKLIELIDSSGCGAVSFAGLKFFEESHPFKQTGTIVYDKLSEGKFCDLKQFMSTTKTPASQGNYLFTRDSYDKAGGYPEEGGLAESGVLETWRFGFLQHVAGMRIAILPGSFYWHRFSPNGLWMQAHKKGLNDKIAVRTLRRHKHLFMDESVKLLLDKSNEVEGICLCRLSEGLFKLKE